MIVGTTMLVVTGVIDDAFELVLLEALNSSVFVRIKNKKEYCLNKIRSNYQMRGTVPKEKVRWLNKQEQKRL